MAEGEPKKSGVNWVELSKVVAMPVVTLIVGYLFNSSLNSRQEQESRVRLYADAMGKREESDSALRREMFKSILDSFLKPDTAKAQNLDAAVLNMELLAYNFDESLDLGPLFRHVHRELGKGHGDSNLLWRLERAAHDVKGRQIELLAASGAVETGELILPPPTGDAPEGASAWRMGKSMIPLKPGQRVRGPTLCMSIKSEKGGGATHHRQFKISFVDFMPERREVQFHLEVSKPLSEAECHELPDSTKARDNLDLEATFWVGLFTFPIIDTTHLSQGERCAVTVNSIDSGVARVSVAFFPASRAKDRTYYDEVRRDLLNGSGTSESK